VLVVSNSAGSAKDRGGIGAESLSMSLRAPVLAHKHAKPACAKDIIDFFAGRTAPHTLRSKVVARLEAAEATEESAEEDLLRTWRGAVNGPLCGPLRDKEPTLEAKMVAAQMKRPGTGGVTTPVPPPPRAPESTPAPAAEPAPTATEPEPLRILVVGDRLFTDTLQARELDKYLATSPFPATLSIQNTDIPQPHDVRLLRALENWLSGNKLAHDGKAGGVDWTRYAIVPPPPEPEPRWIDVQLDRINPVKRLDDGGPPITWDPRSWRPRPVAAAILSAAGRATAYVSRFTAQFVKVASVRGYDSAKRWISRKWAELKEERRRRAAEREQAQIEHEGMEHQMAQAQVQARTQEPPVGKDKA